MPEQTLSSISKDKGTVIVLEQPLRVLTPEQIAYIDQLLASLGAFGEIRLIKKGGKLRFVEKLESFDASYYGEGES